MTLHSAVLEITLNAKSRNVNTGDLANPLDDLVTNDILIKHLGWRAKLLFTTESMPDLKLKEKSIEETINSTANARTCSQPPRNCVRQNAQKMYQGTKIFYVYMYGCFSFCFLVCKSNILFNRTNIFRDKTSFCQFLTWLLPGLKKMLILIISQHWRCQSVGMSCNFLDIDG